MPTPIKSDADKLRIIADYLTKKLDSPTHTVIQTLEEVAKSVEQMEKFNSKLKQWNADAGMANEKLAHALQNVVDACEDKNGQFRAWHQNLRKCTTEAKELL